VNEPVAKRYRFTPLDRTGMLLGLSGAQCVIIAGSLIAAGAVLGQTPVASICVLVAGIAAAFAAWSGEPAYRHVATRGAWHARKAVRKTRWTAPAPWLRRAAALRLPPVFGRVEVLTAGQSAVLLDRRDRTMTVVVPVLGHPLALLEPADQDRLAAGWGEVLGSLAGHRSPIVRLTVSEWAGRAGQLATTAIAAHGQAETVADYDELVQAAAPLSRRHETLLALTVRTSGRDLDAGAKQAIEQGAFLTARLEQLGLTPRPLLTTAELAAALRARIAVGPSMAKSTSLRAASPVAQRSEWSRTRLDQGLHVVYWIAEWPRLPVSAGWLEALLLNGDAQRSVTIVFEPVAPAEAARRIRRDATRLSADRQQRERSGWRIGADQARTEAEVEQLEVELAAGHAQLNHVGLIDVTAANPGELEAACRGMENTAANVGIELRRLDGQHDQALPAALGLLGRPLPAPRLR
jgi:hypothetical protein